MRNAATALVLFGALGFLLIRAGISAPGPFWREAEDSAPSPPTQPSLAPGPASSASTRRVDRRQRSAPTQPQVPPASSQPSSPTRPAPPSQYDSPSSATPSFETTAVRPAPIGAAAVGASPHVVLGIPTDADPADDILLDHHHYVVSYNPKRNGPNWASWELNRSHLGLAPREKQFHPDPLLPSAYRRIEPHDYAHSGYDRGHLCPSADRSRDREDNAATFLMTNVLPELHELNAGPWEKLEEYERHAVSRPDAQLAIVAGGIWAPSPPIIGPGIAVPRAFYKAIVFLRKGQTAADVTDETEVVAVIMPNEPGVGHRSWNDFVTSVEEVERQSGYDLFNKVPTPIQRQWEARRGRPTAAQ